MGHRTGNALWVLAFDGSCGRCRRISEIVTEASRGRLEVRPLADPEVRRWREQALGSDAPWAPTVVNVQADRVRAWTGPMLGVRLARRLGPTHTVRVLRALGELEAAPVEPATESGVRRRGLLKLGIGVGVGAGLMFSGTAPAFATPEPRMLAAARAWARANQTPRAGQYDELARFELIYRKTIFADLSPTVRRELWREQLSRFRVAHPELTAEQIRQLDQADALLAEATLFDKPGSDLRQRLEDLETAAVEAFGRDRTCGLFFTLGPTDTSKSDPRQGCSCSVGSVCDGGGCTGGPCAPSDPGCGCFYAWPCDGCYGCV